MDWFIYLLFGHLIGEFLLQNSWMTHNKKLGPKACFAHSFVYTFSICLFLLATPHIHAIDKKFALLALIIFSAHFLMDAFWVVDWWFKKLEVFSCYNLEIAKRLTHTDSIFISFGTFYYIVAENTLNLLIAWMAVKFLYGL